MSNKTPYVDIADFDEDARIDIIGQVVMTKRKIGAFVVEDDAKADRYVRKLKERYPGIVEEWRGPGPIANTVTVRMGPPTETN